MRIRSARPSDEKKLTRLIAGFRRSLARSRGKTCELDLAAAGEELAEYQKKDFPIYVAEGDAATLIGFLVCRVEGNVVWAESLYVTPEHRRRGVGTALYAEAERLAEALGGDTVYNWVDPSNVRIIRFLEKQGYTVLNLVELRRAHPGEEPMGKICVGPHEFDC